MTAAEPLSIGALSKQANCNIETIRYYEKIGLLPKPARRSSGYRTYTQADVKRLRFLRRARELGFSIDGVRALLRLADERERSCGKAHGIAVHHLTDIRKRISDLRSIERVLARTAAACRGGNIPECALLDLLAA